MEEEEEDMLIMRNAVSESSIMTHNQYIYDDIYLTTWITYFYYSDRNISLYTKCIYIYFIYNVYMNTNT